MKKINFLKGIALSVSALMVFSLSGCDYISELIGNINNGGNNNNISGDDNNTEPELTISQTELTLAVGASFPLSASSSDGAPVTWSSDNTDIATVDNGVVTGVAEGKTMIYAETEALTQICYVTVTAEQTTPPQVEDTLTLSQTNLSLKVGDSQTLTATCLVNGAVANLTVKWTATCSPSGCLTVASGKITAVKAGVAVVTASATFPSGKTLKATCSVKVTAPDDSDKNGYTLVWCDEFNGNSLDTTKWNYQTGTQDTYGSASGPSYWGNSELQYYTEDAVSVSEGSLKITAKKQQKGDRNYTSGRILTRDKSSWTYGYFEAKMRTPTGNGMWPAFWMLPQPMNSNTLDNQYGSWPANGEIDIMEAKGRLYNMVDTTLHFGKAWNAHDYETGVTQLSSNTDQWHTYAVDWTADAITWYVDGKSVMTVTKNRWWSQDASNQGQSMPFDKPFYILFNLAVGGQYDDYTEPDYATFNSATMEVDYVRVYKKN